ncbi:MAG: hypothetical protein FJ100_11240 [Deltaproteobacteria bacterium]|nr:hypothetical protein [Deltaproteobacteria bacterium]
MGERPFDVPAMPAAAAVRWEDPDAHLSGDLGGALLHLSAGLPPEVAPRRLWFPAGPSHHGQLARLAKAGVEVVWADRGLPDLYVSGGEGEVLMPGAQGRLRLRLTPSQSAALGQLLAAAPVWRFRTEARIGDAAYRNARFWLPEEASASGLQAEQLVELADMTASSLRELPTTAPVEVPAAQPLALTVRYQWTVVPPRVPAGAVEDVLVGRWRKLDQDWQARLATVQEALGEAKHERGRMGRALQRLQSALLGFERTHGGLLQRVEALRAQRPSLVGPGGAATLLSQAAEVEDAARKLHGEQDAAERKAREDDERDRQLAAWQRRTEDAKRELPNRRAALKAAEQRRDACAEELRGVDEAMQAADKTAKKNAVASQRKLADDLQRAEKEIAKHRNEIEDLAQQLAGCFEFRPPPAPASRAQQVKGRFVPVASAARSAVDVPDEKLPEVGTLRSHKGRRYLVIDSWDHLAVGEQAAARLAAHLVAPENT